MTSSVKKLSIAGKIWHILSSSEKRTAIFIFFMMIIGMVLETLGIGLVIPAITLFTQGDIIQKYPELKPFYNFLGSPTHTTLVKWGLFSLLLVYFVKNLFLAFLIWRQTKFVNMVGAQISQKLYSIYLRQPYAFHLKNNSALLLRNVYNEVGVFMGAITAFMTILSESLVLIALCVMLFVIEPLSALIVLVVIGLSAGAFYHFTRNQVKKWGQERQCHEGFRIQHLQQGLSGVKDVLLLGREDSFINEYKLHNVKSASIEQMISTLQQMPRLWLEVLAIIGLVTMVLVMLAQGYKTEFILPVLGFFAIAAFRLMPSANRILGAVQSVRFDLPVINVLFHEMQLPVLNKHFDKSPRLKFKHKLELQSVSFLYEAANHHVINDISLNIMQGESVGIVGSSGAGKSTLVDIILGLLQPTKGEVLVDGYNMINHLRGWQNNIGYVPQSIYLTDDTLRCNVAFGLAKEDINENAVMSAIKAAQLEDFVKELPDGLDTKVGERGVRLSGGQRQRIGIARALYHDPSVLVLDEATSSLDTETEKGVMESVNALHGSKTIIIVAHRLTTVVNCDRLYKLNQGMLIDEGTPEQILRSTM